MNKILIFALIFLLPSCGGNNKANEVTDINNSLVEIPFDDTGQVLEIPDNRSNDDYKILFYGNSHVAGIPDLVKTIILNGLPNKTVLAKTAPGGQYLADRLNDQASIDALLRDNWSHVIFQAQKYSQSGAFDYPTTAAQTWIRRTKIRNATPILFPEHPQKGNENEGEKVHLIHTQIAALESSCVAPVGLTWDAVLELIPLPLHTSDGNHAKYLGQFLTALVFYEVITGEPADLLPYINEIDVAEDIQHFLGQIASATLKLNPGCIFPTT